MRVKVLALSGKLGMGRWMLLIPKDGISKEYVRNEEGVDWNRKVATDALNVCEQLYQIPRRNVRFYHI